MLDSLDDAQQENNTGSAGWFDRLTTAINGVLPSSAPVSPPVPTPQYADTVADEVTQRLAGAIAARRNDRGS